MKNRSVILCLCVAVAILFLAGCGAPKQEPAKIEKVSDLKGKTIGAISSGISKASYKKMVTALIGGEPKEIIFYNRASDIQAALLSGKVDAAPAHQIAADYYLKRNPGWKCLPVTAKIEGGVIMVVRSDDAALRDKLNKAITTLQDNGTLKALEDKWITNLPATNEPAAAEIPKIAKAKTVYVGITGDIPPLDYIAANGRPAGFNVALMTEIGKLIKVNFEFVTLENQARFAALAGKKIDVIFCHFQSQNTDYFDELKNNKWLPTKPYFTYRGGCFVVKK